MYHYLSRVGAEGRLIRRTQVVKCELGKRLMGGPDPARGRDEEGRNEQSQSVQG